MTTHTSKGTPVQIAAKVYLGEKCARSFEDDLLLHLLHGYVFSTPEMFMMGRPVRRDGTYENITDPTYKFADPDSWLVYLASGDLQIFFKHEPYPLPYIGFERENSLRFYSRERIKRLCEIK
jgi:hypothetical protein